MDLQNELLAAVEPVFGTVQAMPLTGAVAVREWALASSVLAPLLAARGARVVAISGSQGSGKSTLAAILVESLAHLGVRAASASIDDFYLTLAERRQLARDVHPLLETRGVPGTHDVAWLERALRAARDGAAEVVLPRFDKGADDRAGSETLKADVLVIEGWCLGVTPQAEAALAEPVNALERHEDTGGIWRNWVNEQISCHYVPLWSLPEFWIHLRAPGFGVVEAWRGQAESKLPIAQRMDGAALARFVAHYERLTSWQLANAPRGPGVALALDRERRVTAVTAGGGPQI